MGHDNHAARVRERGSVRWDNMAIEPKATVGEELDHELAELLEVERFDSPAEFRAHALLNDPEVYERAGARPARLVDRAGRSTRLV